MNIRHLTTFANLTLLAAVVVLAPANAVQASLTWGAPTGIVGDGDVSTNGTLVAAFNFNGMSTTVNSVTFLPFAAPPGDASSTVGNYTLATSAFAADTATGALTPPFSALSASYQELLGTAASATRDITLTLGGLTIGQQYEFQIWSNNSDDEFHFGITVGDDPTFSNSVFLSSGDGPLDDYELGEYVIGVFTADTVSQQIFIEPDEVANINGFQLRQVAATTAVPEPSSLVVFGLGITVLAIAGCFRLRRENMKN